MRTASIVTGIAAVVVTWTAASAQASRDYPFCASGGKASEGMMCDYATIEQCRASVNGAGGYCVSNPRMAPPPARNVNQPGRR
jgi:Protein of unknown function (DUF3551)